MSNAAGWVVLQVARMGDGVRQGALAEELDISGASLVRQLDQLEANALVLRTPDAADRRTNRLSLTPAGQALAAEIEQAFAALRATLLADVSDTDLTAVNAVLDRIDARIAGQRESRR
ncbi:MarR family winged helix-turn-helix transcriptional regulator [Flavisphingomonas formosensis]|uniref:MarR family winged helix-turn-helix transcriptional regulator n=1 Tax=Flavisphingomonas formosensis TaxID=861534 RepID=UPI001E3541D6|nr:MarR family transcriptional regulator [Sphingomonas formosensis]